MWPNRHCVNMVMGTGCYTKKGIFMFARIEVLTVDWLTVTDVSEELVALYSVYGKTRTSPPKHR